MAPKLSDKNQDISAKSATARIRNSGMKINNEPLPMRNRQQANKNPNAADNFWNTHQAEYDEREEPPNRCNYVDTHNDAYPKLKDELDRKRDASKPTARQSIRQLCQASGIRRGTQTLVSEKNWSDPCCIVCKERRRQARQLSSRNKRRGRDRRTRISKPRRKSPRKRLMTITIGTPKNVQRCNPNAKSSKSNTSVYPDTSPAPSLSSYNSFMSITHEPMDLK